MKLSLFADYYSGLVLQILDLYMKNPPLTTKVCFLYYRRLIIYIHELPFPKYCTRKQILVKM